MLEEQSNRRVRARALLVANIKITENGCWLWLGPFGVGGYGRVYFDGEYLYAHRLAYEAFVGAIPDGHDVHHRCQLECCISPAHLEALTVLEHARAHLKACCIMGHAFTPENTYSRKYTTGRRCRTCDRLRARALKAERRETALTPICPSPSQLQLFAIEDWRANPSPPRLSGTT